MTTNTNAKNRIFNEQNPLTTRALHARPSGILFTHTLEFTRCTSQVLVASQVRVTSPVRVSFCFVLFCSFVFSLVVPFFRSIRQWCATCNSLFATFFFDRKSHYQCVLPLLPRDTRQLSILIHFPRILRPQFAHTWRTCPIDPVYQKHRRWSESKPGIFTLRATEPSCCVHKDPR